MEVRKITQEEYLEYRRLSSICFNYPLEKDHVSWKDELDKHAKDWENRLGAFDENGNLIAALYIIPFEMNFDGHTVKMGGIQAVVTAPEARGSGVMNKVFNECLRMMKEDGQIFSTLYPFSCAYYRKFGYEIAYMHKVIEIDIMPFTKYPFPKDSVRFWKKEEGLADIKAVYEEFRKGRNYAIKRNDWCWERMMPKDEDPYVTKNYTYIHYDSGGKPDSYLRFQPDRRVGGEAVINIAELAWASLEGLYAMFGFIGGLRPQLDKVVWRGMPMDLDIYSMIPEARDVKDITKGSSDTVMTRIVDLPAVLALLKPPSQAKGRVVIEVLDKSLPSNTGKYAISWENGRLSVEKSSQNPDMSTTIEAMAQMLTGYLNSDMAAYRQDTIINSQDEALAALFSTKNLYMWERF